MLKLVLLFTCLIFSSLSQAQSISCLSLVRPERMKSIHHSIFRFKDSLQAKAQDRGFVEQAHFLDGHIIQFSDRALLKQIFNKRHEIDFKDSFSNEELMTLDALMEERTEGFKTFEPQEIFVWVKVKLALGGNKNKQRAVSLIKSLSPVNQRHYRLLWLRAEVEYKMGQKEMAYDLLQDILRKVPAQAVSLEFLGVFASLRKELGIVGFKDNLVDRSYMEALHHYARMQEKRTSELLVFDPLTLERDSWSELLYQKPNLYDY